MSGSLTLPLEPAKFEGVDTSGWPRFDRSRLGEICEAVIHENGDRRRLTYNGFILNWINKKSPKCNNLFGEMKDRITNIMISIENSREFYMQNEVNAYQGCMIRMFLDGVFIAFIKTEEGYKPHEYYDEYDPDYFEYMDFHYGIEGDDYSENCGNVWFLLAHDAPPELTSTQKAAAGGPQTSKERRAEAKAKEALLTIYRNNPGKRAVKADVISWVRSKYAISEEGAVRIWRETSKPDWLKGGKLQKNSRLNLNT